MSEPITVKVKVTELTRNAYEIRTVVKGKFYKRQYIGYSKKKAMELFGVWLNGKI